MALLKVQATYNPGKEGERSIEVEFEFGNDLADAEERFGDEAVFNNYVAQGKISLQAALRRWMAPDNDGNSKTDEEIGLLVAEWAPTAKVLKKKTQIDKAKDLIGKLTDEQRQQLMSALRADMAAA